MTEQEQQQRPGCCTMHEMFHLLARCAGVSDGAQQHFRQSRIEFLKGIRRILDDSIEKHARAADKGSKVVVE